MKIVKLKNSEIQMTIHALNSWGDSLAGRPYRKTIVEVEKKLFNAIEDGTAGEVEEFRALVDVLTQNDG